MHQLIDLFELHGVRLFMAIEMVGNGMLYFDPAFKYVCHASMCFMKELLTLIDEDINPELKALFAAFSEQSISGEASCEVTSRITAIIPALNNQGRRSQS